MTYKIVNGNASSYLSDLLKPYIPSRDLCSQNRGLLSVPSVKKESAGCRGLSSHASFHWNNLPADIRQSDSAEVFKFKFKIHLLTLTFSYLLISLITSGLVSVKPNTHSTQLSYWQQYCKLAKNHCISLALCCPTSTWASKRLPLLHSLFKVGILHCKCVSLFCMKVKRAE